MSVLDSAATKNAAALDGGTAPERRKTPVVPIYCPDWLLLSTLAADVDRALLRHGRGQLLDVGCGVKPYQNAKYPVTQWIGFDTPDNPHADVHGFAYDIPLPDDSVDTVLCTQVLEHLESPHVALSEFRRILRPGGALILTVPQYWPLHEEPRDFFRYTTIGLKHVFVEAGFTVADQSVQGRGIDVAGQALNNAILCAGDTFSFKDHIAFKASKAPFYLAINLLTLLLRPILRTKRDVLNHLIVGLK